MLICDLSVSRPFRVFRVIRGFLMKQNHESHEKARIRKVSNQYWVGDVLKRDVKSFRGVGCVP